MFQQNMIHDTGIVKLIARDNVTEDIVREKIEDIGFTVKD